MQAAKWKKGFKFISNKKIATFYPFTGGSACDAEI